MKQRRLDDNEEWDVNQEIDYLAKMTGVPCWQFRHEIMSGNVTVPATVIVAALINSTLKIIDVTTPATPTVEATAATGTNSGNDDTLQVSGQTAFSLGDDDLLWITDISNKAAPVILSSTACNRAGSGFYRICKVGTKLAIMRSSNVPAQQNTLEIFDVSNLSAPTPLATYDLISAFAAQQSGADILMHGTTAVITADTGAPNFAACIGAYDFTALPIVTQLAVTVTDGPGTSIDLIDIRGNIGYFAAFIVGNVELRTYDLTNPAAPVLLGSLVIAKNLVQFSPVLNDTIYAIGLFPADTTIHAFDVSNPAAPVALAASPAGGVVNRNFSINAGIDATGPKVYTASRQSGGIPRNRQVQIYDATTPAALSFLGAVIYNPLGGNAQLQLAHG